MTADQWLPLLLGPAGLTVGLLFALWQFSRGVWINAALAKERLDEMRAQRDKAMELLAQAVGVNEATAKAIEERNRAEADRYQALRDSRSLSREVEETEARIRRRTPRP